MMLLEAKSLHKIYYEGKKELRVLKSINLKVERGKIISLVGPSGAGKSTLLHILGGLDKPSSGKVMLDGADLYKLSGSLRAKARNTKIGFIFQFYHLLAEFSALENVMLPGLISLGNLNARDNKLKQKAEYLLDEVKLSNRLNHRPSELSGGEQQRVAIARALINDPDIVFCDEPTGNLDSKSGGEIYRLLDKLNKEKNQTFVIATHEKNLVKNTDKIIYIRDGRLARGE